MDAYTPRFPGSGTIVEEDINEGLAMGLAEGGAKTRAEDILRILGLRGIEVPEAVRERVTSCTDLDTQGTWFDRALSVTTGEELLAGA
ncbi:hypothetical protein [Streptomyces sp. NPDC052107]|uniref:hypothetical protein n=1 Tax=Streptomyces sp. NPDC052107 TaxID=3155632 RepID=UPI00341752C7